jgi:hypothetical protein
MSLTVRWSPICEAQSLHVGYGAAERIWMAVYTFARSGSGQVEPVPPVDDETAVIRIHAQGGYALVRVGASGLHIVGIYPSDPRRRRIVPLL